MSRPPVAELAVEVAAYAVQHDVEVGPPVIRALLAEIDRLTFQLQETDAELAHMRGELATARLDRIDHTSCITTDLRPGR